MSIFIHATSSPHHTLAWGVEVDTDHSRLLPLQPVTPGVPPFVRIQEGIGSSTASSQPNEGPGIERRDQMLDVEIICRNKRHQAVEKLNIL